MSLYDLIKPENIVLGLSADSRMSLFRALARLSAERTGLKSVDVVCALTAREKLGSTALGGGVAMPHARVAGLREPFCMFVRLAKSCSIEADAAPADLIFLLLAPERPASEHLLILSQAARLLRDPQVTTHLRQASDPAIARESFAAPQAA